MNGYDRKWAKWLLSSLERYRVPEQLIAQRGVPARINSIFRDEDELAASANLSEHIQTALIESRFLIVVCSPRTPQSQWVNKEVERFRELGRHDQILALLIEGEPRDSFPVALRAIRRKITDDQGLAREQIEEVEPLAADVRELRNESLRHLKRMAKLRLLACMLGCRFDDLRQREQERRTRRNAQLTGAALALVCLMTALAVTALVERRAAISNARRATTALANSDFREGISRLRLADTAAEGIALLARAARQGADQRAYNRLWTLLQQRAFWVDSPAATGPQSAVAPVHDSAANTANRTPENFSVVDFRGIPMKPSWFSRSADGQVFVTIVNGNFGSQINHFRVWRPDATPITDWLAFPESDMDTRELVSAHLSADGRLVAVVTVVWREPQALGVWETGTGRLVGDLIRATGQAPNVQFASFTQVRLLPRPPGDENPWTRLLTASSRGDAGVHQVWHNYPLVNRIGRNEHASSIDAVGVDVQAEWMMSASADRQLRVWDLLEGRPVGQPVLLPGEALSIERAARDRLRVTVRDLQVPIEFQLKAERFVHFSKTPIPPVTPDEDGSKLTGVSLSSVLLPPVGSDLARSMDGKYSVRLSAPNELEAVQLEEIDTPKWRKTFPAPVWRASYDHGVVLVQTVAFTTELFDAVTGRRIGTTLDESRLFDLARRPSRPLASTFISGDSGRSGFVLTRSFFFDAPNVSYFWFTVWDIASGLPLVDRIAVGDDGDDADSNQAALSRDGTVLLLGSRSDPPTPALRSIQLTPPATVRTQLPDLAEALGGLRIELDGTFSAVPNRLSVIGSIEARLK